MPATRRRSRLLVATIPLAAALLSACQFNEARVLAGEDGYGQRPASVSPSAETTPVASSEDAADDAVVLVSASGADAWIAAADKRFGLRVYELSGEELPELAAPVGRLNNIDAVSLGPDRFLVLASNRTQPSITLFDVRISGGELTIAELPGQPLDLAEPYGLCAGTLAGGHYVFVGDKEGEVQQWRLDAAQRAHYVRTFRFATQTEGCVVDAESSRLFVGEETAGIWAVDLADGTKSLIDRVGAGRLIADVEGLDIYHGDGERLLLASSQGDHAFAVYALPDAAPLLRFRIVADEAAGIDGVSETDGIAVSPRALPAYPEGILVVQDGYNVLPPENQNFKIIDWRAIRSLLDANR